MLETNVQKKIFISIILLCSFTKALGAKYTCTISDNGQTCSISGLKLTRSDYKIEPQSGNPSAITKIVVRGIVPVLTSGICEAFPNLIRFDFDSVSMEKIEPNTFKECKKLNRIDLDYNKFINLDMNSFKGLTSLETLWMSGGNISEIDIDLRDMKNLKELRFSSSNLAAFNADILREQKDLNELKLYSNNLFDLDVEGIIKYAPNLKTIYLVDNNFRCSRLTEILSILKSKNIQVNSDGGSRIRSYTPNKIEGIHCLSDHQWKFELLKDVSLNDNDVFLEYLKTIPLGKSINKILLQIGNNSASIKNVEKDTNEQIKNLTEKYEIDVSKLQLKIDDLDEKNNDLLKSNVENHIELQKNMINNSEAVDKKFNDINNKFVLIQETVDNSIGDKFKNLTEVIERLEAELTEVEQKSQIVDNTQDIHQGSLWTVVGIIFIVVILIVIYLIREKRSNHIRTETVSNAVHFSQ